MSEQKRRTRPGKFEHWQNDQGLWEYHLVAGNGEILDGSHQGYETEVGVLNGIAAARHAAATAPESERVDYATIKTGGGRPT